MGYPITQFVSNPSVSICTCLVCNNIAETPLLLKCCESLVCDACFKTMNKCANGCIEKFKAKPLSGPSKKFYELLAVKCSHSPTCEWTDSLSTLNSHLSNECNFHPLPCANKGCDTKFVRTELENHKKECPYRLRECVHCKENVTFLETENHYTICPCFPVCCPHNQECLAIVPRLTLNKHFEICPAVIVKCSWEGFGCKFSGKRCDLESHLKTSVVSHLKTVKDKMKDLNPIQKEHIDLVFDEEGTDKDENENSNNDVENNEQLLVASLKRESEKLGDAFQLLQSQLSNKRIKLENMENEYKKLKDQFTTEKAVLKARLEKIEEKFKRVVVADNFKERSIRFETASFTIDGLEWNLCIYPHGFNSDDHLSVYLNVPAEKRTPIGWERRDIDHSIKLVNPKDDSLSIKTTLSPCTFNSKALTWGWTQFITLTNLREKGFIADNKLIFEVSTNV
eukprot:TRINITY_DN6217_c0_g1_i1.p1 TRINITY_DN6217_c0_g1~~TRINITY_DN6217_c0_g1_i1.p1  ORF type:complete len:453 (-),score=62.67 TRINITY_DN6217_c0_g1_i1:69-1427(-)